MKFEGVAAGTEGEIYVEGLADTERDMIRFMENVILHLFIYAYIIFLCDKIIIMVLDQKINI